MTRSEWVSHREQLNTIAAAMTELRIAFTFFNLETLLMMLLMMALETHYPEYLINCMNP